MYYSQQYALEYSADTIESFLGYNKNLRIKDNEFGDMINMTGDSYPVITTRAKRSIVKTLENPQGIVCRDTLCYVDGNDFYINGSAVPGLMLSTLPADCPKQLVSMGSYVCIFPDKKYVNTENLSDYGSMEASFAAKSASVTYRPCKKDGSDINATVSASAPNDPQNGKYWLDTSGDTHTLKVWSDSSSMWVSVATSYVKINCNGIGVPFQEDDCVTISDSGVTDINGSYIIDSKDTNYLIVVGQIDKVTTVNTSISVKRTLPIMDYVVECNNRLWGCHYGPTTDGVVNELYACKLGDFKNWNYFSGTSIDSYAVSLGSDGIFTGAVSYQNTPVFFKENYIHHVYGSYPENYTLTSFTCNGVQKGSNNSVCVVDGDVLYKGNNGIFAYNGQLPSLSSYALGDIKYHSAVAGALNGKYFISMKDYEGKSHFFVYNARTGIWYKEDNTEVQFFEKVDDELYFVDSENRLVTEFGSSGTTENIFDWLIETSEFGYNYSEKKYIKSLSVRLSLDLGAFANIYIKYDNEDWEYVSTVNGPGMKSERIYIPIQRCDRFKIKISGSGQCQLYSITKKFNLGSDK